MGVPLFYPSPIRARRLGERALGAPDRHPVVAIVWRSLLIAHIVDDDKLPAEGQDYHAVDPTTRVPAITVRAGQARASANPHAFHQLGLAITVPHRAADAGMPNDVANTVA
jgi:hypothetical protein